MTLSNVTEGEDETPATFDFSTNLPISGVIVKSGNGALLYSHDPPVTSDTGLESPNPSISHLDFCWDEDDTTDTTAPTTDTTAPTTDTTAPTTDTTAPTTATTAPAGSVAPAAAPAVPVMAQPTYTG